jgi:hypothetical protein
MVGAVALAVASGAIAAPIKPEVMMWRLDCGQIQMNDASPPSDTNLYAGKARRLTVS